MSVTIHVTLDLSIQNADHISSPPFPQNYTRLGDKAVEVTITQNANKSISLLLVFNEYSIIKFQGAIGENCSGLTVSDPTLFNSTSNLRLGTLVQLFRGDCVVTPLWGNESARELSDSSNPIPAPPLPPSTGMNMSAWECLNYTIGESIAPFMNAASGFTSSTIVLRGPCFIFFLFLSFLFFCSCLNNRRHASRGVMVTSVGA